MSSDTGTEGVSETRHRRATVRTFLNFTRVYLGLVEHGEGTCHGLSVGVRRDSMRDRFSPSTVDPRDQTEVVRADGGHLRQWALPLA